MKQDKTGLPAAYIYHVLVYTSTEANVDMAVNIYYCLFHSLNPPEKKGQVEWWC